MKTRAAIFDLDGTLIPHTSAEKTFFFYMLRSGQLSPVNLIQMAAALWSAKGNLHEIVRGNKRYLRHKKVEILEHVARDYFEPQIDRIVFPGMRAIVDRHRQNGDILLLLSGTLDIIAGCFTRKLKLDGFRAATLEIHGGRYTGRIQGILPYGMGKLEVLRDLRKQYSFVQNQTVLYANMYSDRYVMNAIEHPVAVNPDKKLHEYAQKMGWETIHFKQTRGRKVINR